jgi:hypothetical protein
MRPFRRDEQPLQIQITGRNIRCDTFEDRELLAQAKAVAANQASSDYLSLEHLYLIRAACQRYALGKAQRALKIAIDARTIPGP